jgi:D-3-phosphoglycerate dehydrogenase
MKPRLLITESSGMAPEAITMLRRVAEVELADLTRDELLAAIPLYDAVWVRLRHRLDAALLGSAARLRLIASPTTGLDHIDLEAAQRAGVAVVSLRGAEEFLKDVRATAELTLGLMLALLRHLPEAVHDVRAGGWNRDQFKGRELYRKTVGIIGFGRLGRIVARYLLAFGARVVACDPRGVEDAAVEAVSLTTLLAVSDIVTVHVSLTDETRGLIGAPELGAMKRGAYLINTSRGDLVDDVALLAALGSGNLAGAALDVITGESATGVANSPLVAYARLHSNLLITPHIGGCTQESMAMTEVFIAQRVIEMLSNPGKPDV